MITKSAEETKKLAAKIAQEVKGGQVLALSGDLGGGKTTFIQGLAKGLGVKPKITSPTFVLLKNYQTAKGFGLVHIDLYRLEKIKEIESMGIADYLSKKDFLVVIEWAEKIKKFLPKDTIWIRFDFIDKNSRKISIKGLK